MVDLFVPKPLSGGLILSYQCNSRCKHCMYACAPTWKANWMSDHDVERILAQLAGTIQGSPLGPDKIGLNHGLHFTGGEPFLNFDLLLKAVQTAHDLNIPSTFVETNCFWSVNDKATREKLEQLKHSGLHGILISVNPFILEYVPFERTNRAIRISTEVFGGNVIPYQEFFYHQFQGLDVQDTLSFEKYLRRAGAHSLSYIELLPLGRACYDLEGLYKTHPANTFFGASCRAELTRPWHIHVDNYGNYITGYCGGLSLGDARHLASLRQINLDDRPILRALVTDVKDLYELGEEYGYEERGGGYVSKCHLCVDIRKHIVQKTDAFMELSPREFYWHLAS